MEKAVVVIVILAICFVIYFLCVGKKDGSSSAKREKTAPEAAPQPEKPRYEDVSTHLVARLSIEQLDRNGRVVKSFEHNNIPPEGLTISRPGAKLGDIILSEAGGEDAMTVGTESIVIAEDEKGIFGKIFDNGREKNKLYLYDPVTGKSREVTQFDVADKTLICIGRQWIRFSMPTAPGAPVPANGFQPAAQVPPVQAPAAPVRQQPAAVQPSAPSGFSFESSFDDNGRIVITRKK